MIAPPILNPNSSDWRARATWPAALALATALAYVLIGRGVLVVRRMRWRDWAASC